jgi:hypothetical protein
MRKHGPPGLHRLRDLFCDRLNGAVPYADGEALDHFLLLGLLLALQDVCEEELAKETSPSPDNPVEE